MRCVWFAVSRARHQLEAEIGTEALWQPLKRLGFVNFAGPLNLIVQACGLIGMAFTASAGLALPMSLDLAPAATAGLLKAGDANTPLAQSRQLRALGFFKPPRVEEAAFKHMARDLDAEIQAPIDPRPELSTHYSRH
jgi:hypothetical protein